MCQALFQELTAQVEQRAGQLTGAQPGPVASRSLGVGPKLLMRVSGTVRGEKGWLFALDFILNLPPFENHVWVGGLPLPLSSPS